PFSSGLTLPSRSLLEQLRVVRLRLNQQQAGEALDGARRGDIPVGGASIQPTLRKPPATQGVTQRWIQELRCRVKLCLGAPVDASRHPPIGGCDTSPWRDQGG